MPAETPTSDLFPPRSIKYQLSHAATPEELAAILARGLRYPYANGKTRRQWARLHASRLSRLISQESDSNKGTKP